MLGDRLALVRMVSASLVQVKGWQRSFQASMKVRMAVMRSLTLVKLPRRVAWRVTMPKRISIMFSQDPEAGVKCRVIRGLRTSRALTPGVLVGGVDAPDLPQRIARWCLMVAR